jgi:hypothetical protein
VGEVPGVFGVTMSVSHSQDDSTKMRRRQTGRNVMEDICVRETSEWMRISLQCPYSSPEESELSFN